MPPLKCFLQLSCPVSVCIYMSLSLRNSCLCPCSQYVSPLMVSLRSLIPPCSHSHQPSISASQKTSHALYAYLRQGTIWCSKCRLSMYHFICVLRAHSSFYLFHKHWKCSENDCERILSLKYSSCRGCSSTQISRRSPEMPHLALYDFKTCYAKLNARAGGDVTS